MQVKILPKVSSARTEEAKDKKVKGFQKENKYRKDTKELYQHINDNYCEEDRTEDLTKKTIKNLKQKKTEVVKEEKYIEITKKTDIPIYLGERNLTLFDKKNAKKWASAHKGEYKSLMDSVIEKVEYIPEKAFSQAVDKCITFVGNTITTNKMLAKAKFKTHCFVIGEKGKSTGWLRDKALVQLKETVKDKDNSFNFESLPQGGDKAEFFKMPEVKNLLDCYYFVVFDDASYSGDQISAVAKNIGWVVQTYVEKNYLVGKNFKIIISAALVTSETINKFKFARAYIQSLYKKNSVEIVLHFEREMKLISEIFDDTKVKKLNDLWYKYDDVGGCGSRALTYLHYKVPNSRSFPLPLTNGQVYELDKEDNLLIQKETIPFMPDCKEEYKGK